MEQHKHCTVCGEALLKEDFNCAFGPLWNTGKSGRHSSVKGVERVIKRVKRLDQPPRKEWLFKAKWKGFEPEATQRREAAWRKMLALKKGQVRHYYY